MAWNSSLKNVIELFAPNTKKVPSRSRKRFYQIEILEERDLLSVSPIPTDPLALDFLANNSAIVFTPPSLDPGTNSATTNTETPPLSKPIPEAAYGTLSQYSWPTDCKAIIAGAYGGNLTTKDQFTEILAFFRRHEIEVEGFGFTDDIDGIFVDRSGNWIVVPNLNYKIFFNGPPPTIYPR